MLFAVKATDIIPIRKGVQPENVDLFITSTANPPLPHRFKLLLSPELCVKLTKLHEQFETEKK